MAEEPDPAGAPGYFAPVSRAKYVQLTTFRRDGRAVATPVLFLLSEDELRHVLSDSGAVLAITTPEFLPKVAAAAAGLAGLRGIVVAGEVPAPPAGGPPLLAFAELEAAAPAALKRPSCSNGPWTWPPTSSTSIRSSCAGATC